MKYALLVFDWDGTLADSTWRIVYCFQQAAKDVHLEEPDADIIRDCIGLDLPHTIRKIFPDLPGSQCALVQERYWQYFTSEETASIHLFDGALDLLKKLKSQGYKLAVATGKSRRGLDKDLEDTGIGGLFETTVTADEAPSKPNPTMLHDIMAFIGVTAGETLVIGDSPYDLDMASSAGVRSVAVSYGAQPVEALQALATEGCIDDISGLLRYLK